MKFSRIVRFVSASLFLVPTLVSANIIETVSTAFGIGADLEIREQSNSVDDGMFMNSRTSSGGDRNEIMAMAFDLSGYTLLSISGISLNLVSYRLDESTRVVDLYGVAQGATGGNGAFNTETWDESITLFDDMPGLQLTDADYLTQSINPGAVTHLGQFTIASGQPEGSIQSLSSEALNDFVRSYTGSSRLTLLLAAGNQSTGQFRVATREATGTANNVLAGSEGDFAPYLEFTVVPEPTVFALVFLTSGVVALSRRSPGSV